MNCFSTSRPGCRESATRLRPTSGRYLQNRQGASEHRHQFNAERPVFRENARRAGKPAFSQVKGDVSFKEYFESQHESFKRSWLGPKRYELYSQGKYNPMSLGNPDTGYVVPVEDLK